jgi:hypothetical protein
MNSNFFVFAENKKCLFDFEKIVMKVFILPHQLQSRMAM